MQNIIEIAWNNRSLLKDSKTQDTVKKVVDLLDQGKLRVAEPTNKGWKVNEWIKKAVILYFPIQKMETLQAGPLEFHDKIPLKIYGDKEDKKYANKLFKIVLQNDDELNSLIEKFTPDWENERIANLDLIIIKMCICEFMYFPSIPVRVSMNEYVEISKDYSSPESGKFINGVVNNILKDLNKKNLLEKNERGSQ